MLNTPSIASCRRSEPADKLDWLVYDLIVEGVSLISTYRAEFAARARAVGVTGLLDHLELHAAG